MTANADQIAKQTAEDFRRDHRLGVQPLGDLVAIIEQTTGYDVAVLDAGQDEHGLTMCDPVRGAVFIGVARSRNPMRQRSTLANELGHLVVKGWKADGEFGRRTPEEIQADSFARHLLAPVDGVREFLGERESTSESELSAVVQHFLVSPAIAAIAMRDAGYVDHSVANDWMQYRTPQLATRFGWSDYYAALQSDSDRLRAPQNLVARAVRGYAEGVVSAQTIATLRAVDVEIVRAELLEAGVHPVEHRVTEITAEELPRIDVDLSELTDEDNLL